MKFVFASRSFVRSFVVAAGLGLAALSIPALSGQTTTLTPPANSLSDPYTTAVNEYVSAASKEINAIHDEVVANEKIGKKVRFSPVRAGVAKCQELIAKLKDAGPNQFDALKSEYERVRADLLQKLDTARKG